MRNTTEVEERTGSGARGFGALLRLRIELWLVVVFMALAFAGGIVVTALYEEEPGRAGVDLQQPAGQLPVAPPLTDQQLQGELPAGHPDIAGPTGASGPVGGGSSQGGAEGSTGSSK
ncbi:MAG TPA: hypothetical protein VE669_00675 [Actinomycetota bacterium]|nr:hypothetical protein [Actinomycetota bacterium]